MLSVQARTSHTSRGFVALSPWNISNYTYTVGMLNLGNNPNSKLEVVSALNSFNIANCQSQLDYYDCAQKYNPKMYLGTVQSVATNWNLDRQNGQDWRQKSGSCFN